MVYLIFPQRFYCVLLIPLLPSLSKITQLKFEGIREHSYIVLYTHYIGYKIEFSLDFSLRLKFGIFKLL